MSGANLLSWFSLGLLAGAATLTLVPAVGMALAFLVVMFGLLAALLAHAVAEDGQDRFAIVRVAAAYLITGSAMGVAGVWWMAIILVSAAAATGVQAQRWNEMHPATAGSATA